MKIYDISISTSPEGTGKLTPQIITVARANESMIKCMRGVYAVVDIHQYLAEVIDLLPDEIPRSCVEAQYIFHGAITENKYGAEYNNQNWPDYWEIIHEYFYSSIGISYENRKQKTAVKLQKQEADAAAAVAEGKERLAAKIRGRKMRPQNWKRSVQTLQLGNLALEFTSAIHHFITSHAKDYGLEGLDWKWCSLCSNSDPLISSKEIALRLKDKRDVRSRNYNERKRAAERTAIGIFTEGDDYANKYEGSYVGGHSTRSGKKYTGEYVRDLFRAAGSGDGEGFPSQSAQYVIKAELLDIQNNLIIPTNMHGGGRNPTTPAAFIREVFIEAKLHAESDFNYVFIADHDTSADHPSDDNTSSVNITHAYILKSLTVLHKHANVIVRFPIELTPNDIFVIHIMAAAFSTCEIAYPTAGGTLFICAMDFRKNITQIGEKNIRGWLDSVHPDYIASGDLGPEFNDFLLHFGEIYGKIISDEAEMFGAVSDLIDREHLYGNLPQERGVDNDWINKYQPRKLSLDKRLIRIN